MTDEEIIRDYLVRRVNEVEVLIDGMPESTQEDYRESALPHKALAAFDRLHPKTIDLASLNMSAKTLRKKTTEEKLAIVDAIIDRDAALWKERARSYCDFGYYFRFLNGGVALTERQR